MNSMLKNIYYQRYGKILLVLMGVFTFIYVGSGVNSVGSWYELKEYFYSEEFSHSYDKDTSYQIKDYQHEIPVYYQSIQEYRDDALTVFDKFYFSHLAPAESTLSDYTNNDYELIEGEANDYQVGGWYSSQLYSYITIVARVIFCLGFLLFFVDQKTNFNRFLFSLPFKRRELFLGKVVYVALPLLGFLALMIVSYSLILYWGIPKPYMNVTLLQLLYSSFSHWMYLVFALTAGIFFGTMLGNLVFGVLAILAGILLLSGNFNWAYSNLNLLVTYFFPQVRFVSATALFVTEPGKTGSPWLFLLILFGVSLLFLYLGERMFHKISLENNGQFVTSPEIRLPVCITIIIGSLLFFGLLNFDLTGMVVNEYPYFWRDLLIQIVVIIVVSVTLVYSQNIRNWLLAKRDLRILQK